MRRVLAAVVLIAAFTGCGFEFTTDSSSRAPTPTPGSALPTDRRTPTPTPGPPAPSWAQAPIEADDAFLDAWEGSTDPGPSTCAAIAPEPNRIFPDASKEPVEARRANFGSEWGVAYDTSGFPGVRANGSYCKDCGRGSMGIAGRGLRLEEIENKGPGTRSWSDGSSAVYGPQEVPDADAERYVAYLTIPGQECLYELWSYLSENHVLVWLDHLRFVAGTTTSPTPD